MRKIALSILFISLLWTSGFVYYIYLTKSYNIDNQITNAIIVSTGLGHRIETAVSLLKAGYAPILFIVGVESQNQLKNFLKERNVHQDQVIYSLSTINNSGEYAQRIVDFIITHNLTSVRLVNTAYDIPIILREIKRLLPTTVTVRIIVQPISSEYNKYNMLLKSYNNYLKILLLESI